jgi:hypothetical protein
MPLWKRRSPNDMHALSNGCQYTRAHSYLSLRVRVRGGHRVLLSVKNPIAMSCANWDYDDDCHAVMPYYREEVLEECEICLVLSCTRGEW